MPVTYSDVAQGTHLCMLLQSIAAAWAMPDPFPFPPVHATVLINERRGPVPDSPVPTPKLIAGFCS